MIPAESASPAEATPSTHWCCDDPSISLLLMSLSIIRHPSQAHRSHRSATHGAGTAKPSTRTDGRAEQRISCSPAPPQWRSSRPDRTA
jgi:hypothetical protein